MPDARIKGDAVPRRPTPSTPPVAARAVVPLARAALLVGALLGVGLAAAAPAAAAGDPSAPTATVTRGPSCDPGGMEITVTAGTAPYAVVLSTTRTPEGEDRAQLQPGGSAVLRTGDVDWGESVDPRLEYTALDGSGTSFVDDLDDWTLTRPSREDCAAIGAPAATPTPTTAGSSPEPGGTPEPGPAPAPRTGERTPPAPSPQRDPAPSTSEQVPAAPAAAVASGAAGDDGPSSRAVGAGHPITVRATGFRPGERVSVRVRGAVLASGTAGADGSVVVGLRVPAGVSGPTRLDLVGGTSRTTAGLQLQVAAQQTPQTPAGRPLSWPALLALLSLVVSGSGVVAVLGRRARSYGSG
jgi:hypothetical protein